MTAEAAVDREAVLDVVKRILTTDGVSAVTAEAVGAAIGVAPDTVRSAVDLQDMTVEAYRELGVGELAEVRRTVLANPSPAAQMRALLSWLATPPEESDALRLEMWALSRRNPALRDIVRRHEEAWHGVVASVVRRGARDGDFPQADADEIAAHLISLADGVNNYELIGYRTQTDRLGLLRRVVQAELGLVWGSELQTALR
ncbi:MAG: TetR family transcriptional regulator C-terminal domain-containing protein [Amnibacterium sp.]